MRVPAGSAQCTWCNAVRLLEQCDRHGTRLALKKQYLRMTAAARAMALARIPDKDNTFFEKPKIVKKPASERQKQPAGF